MTGISQRLEHWQLLQLSATGFHFLGIQNHRTSGGQWCYISSHLISSPHEQYHLLICEANTLTHVKQVKSSTCLREGRQATHTQEKPLMGCLACCRALEGKWSEILSPRPQLPCWSLWLTYQITVEGLKEFSCSLLFTENAPTEKRSRHEPTTHSSQT